MISNSWHRNLAETALCFAVLEGIAGTFVVAWAPVALIWASDIRTVGGVGFILSGAILLVTGILTGIATGPIRTSQESGRSMACWSAISAVSAALLWVIFLCRDLLVQHAFNLVDLFGLLFAVTSLAWNVWFAWYLTRPSIRSRFSQAEE